jgi:hypothetical protein
MVIRSKMIRLRLHKQMEGTEVRMHRPEQLRFGWTSSHRILPTSAAEKLQKASSTRSLFAKWADRSLPAKLIQEQTGESGSRFSRRVAPRYASMAEIPAREKPIPFKSKHISWRASVIRSCTMEGFTTLAKDGQNRWRDSCEILGSVAKRRPTLSSLLLSDGEGAPPRARFRILI